MNNFDTSSTGEKIEFSIFYDNDLASIYYDDFIKGSDGNEVNRLEVNWDIFLYIIGDSSKPYYKESELQKMKKAELYELCNKYDLLGYMVALNDYKKADYISDLLNVTIERHYEYLVSEYGFWDIQEHISHGFYISRGYCQGDVAIIVDIGADYDVLKCRESINNILWDSPISGVININDNEYHIDELLSDCYEYDKNELIESINKLNISDYAKEWLCDNLPDCPDYLY